MVVKSKFCECCEPIDGSPATICRNSFKFYDKSKFTIKSKRNNSWSYNQQLTDMYLNHLDFASSHGISFTKKTVLVTGAGIGSIGEKLVQGLLSGGAHVVVTTSSYSSKVTKDYQNTYAHYGARGSRLIVLPFNQGSQQDTENLLDYIYDEKSGLGWDLDHIIPFAAVSENSREIDNIDSKSELAHRVMLTNTLRLLGEVKKRKTERNIRTRPAQVILPLSPNHGTFGNDGLYSESKLGLEALFNKWHSETWSEYLSICGVTIGWTRGTGLMSENDIICEGIENLGIKTFSQNEIAFSIIWLINVIFFSICQLEPLLADFSGGMETIPNLKEVTVSSGQRSPKPATFGELSSKKPSLTAEWRMVTFTNWRTTLQS